MNLKTLNRIARILEKETGRTLPGTIFQVWGELKNFSGEKSKRDAAERMAFCLFGCDFSKDPDTARKVIERL